MYWVIWWVKTERGERGSRLCLYINRRSGRGCQSSLIEMALRFNPFLLLLSLTAELSKREKRPNSLLPLVLQSYYYHVFLFRWATQKRDIQNHSHPFSHSFDSRYFKRAVHNHTTSSRRRPGRTNLMDHVRSAEAINFLGYIEASGHQCNCNAPILLMLINLIAGLQLATGCWRPVPINFLQTSYG